MTIEIVDLPIENGDFPYNSYVSLPEGRNPYEPSSLHGFDLVTG